MEPVGKSQLEAVAKVMSVWKLRMRVCEESIRVYKMYRT